MERFAMAANEPNHAKALEQKLDELFNAPTATTGREQPDITGLIGQYAHGNEPSHHMAYLYNFAGKPQKATQKIHYILDEFYKNAPDGLIGNEDCGQMSAWYILSSMGIYPVTPGKAEWATTVPNFETIKVNFEDGTTKTITPGTTADELRYFGFAAPSSGLKPEYPVEKSYPAPEINASGKSFTHKEQVSISHPSDGLKVFYRFIGSDRKNPAFKQYSKPFSIDRSGHIEAFVEDSQMKRSQVVSAQFFKKPNDYDVALVSTYNPQYHAGGAHGLLDGIMGTDNWRKGDWQGYQGQDFEAVVDLKKRKSINTISVGFLQDSRSWILMPTSINIEFSDDGKVYKSAGALIVSEDPKRGDTFIKSYSVASKGKARFVRVRATNFGKLPQWHQGFGGDAFIFIDEIKIQ